MAVKSKGMRERVFEEKQRIIFGYRNPGKTILAKCFLDVG